MATVCQYEYDPRMPGDSRLKPCLVPKGQAGAKSRYFTEELAFCEMMLLEAKEGVRDGYTRYMALMFDEDGRGKQLPVFVYAGYEFYGKVILAAWMEQYEPDIDYSGDEGIEEPELDEYPVDITPEMAAQAPRLLAAKVARQEQRLQQMLATMPPGSVVDCR